MTVSWMTVKGSLLFPSPGMNAWVFDAPITSLSARFSGPCRREIVPPSKGVYDEFYWSRFPRHECLGWEKRALM